MEALIDTGVSGDKDSESVQLRDSLLEQITHPVVYQLVRVEGDGRLVPATDDEVIEFEHLLEDEKKETPYIEDQSHSERCVSNEVLYSKKPVLEGSEGLFQSENTEFNSQKLDTRLEDIDVMLPKVKKDGRSRLSSDIPNSSVAHNKELQFGNISLETVHPNNAHCTVQSETGLTSTEYGTEPFTSRSSVSKLSESPNPEFSLLRGEICLNNLTVSGLQEVYRATFGRATSVKDKLWLKRHILMGLSESYDHSMESSIVKEEKVLHNIVKEESLCRVITSEVKTASSDQIDGSRNILLLDSLPPKQKNYLLALSGKRLRRSAEICNEKCDNLEQIAAKRVRKPTRRYIEELSEIENRECTGTLSDSVKSFTNGQSSPVTRMMPVQNIGSQDSSFVTRQDSLGGCHIQIPYVSRVRRGRPRKNFRTLMNLVGLERHRKIMEIPHIEEEQDTDHMKIDLYGDTSDEYADAVPALKYSARRKHHRAWSLSEVMKLVEGVARYGTGRWSEIKRLSFASHAYRTSVDLKDKWRNLLRASFAQGTMEKGVRKHASMAVPTCILLRVRELSELHSHPGIEFGPTKLAGNNGRIAREKGSGFL